MKQLCSIKCLTVFILISFIGTFAYGDTILPDPMEMVSGSKYYGQMTKAQAAEIIEKCAGKTYEAQSIVEEDKFFMSVPKQTYAHPSGIRTITKFKWADVKYIQLLKDSIKLTYDSTFFGRKTERSLEFAPHTYTLADLALAATTLTGLPLNREEAIPAASAGKKVSSGQGRGAIQNATDTKAVPDLEESLIKLKSLYDKGLITEAVYESKQKELLDSMLGE
ncbi:MAG: SHOCT domain-containing protein [Pseudomonadota bacterium]